MTQTSKQRKEIDCKRQLKEQGKISPLSGSDRELLTCPFNDDIRKAPVYALQRHKRKGSNINQMLTSKEIGKVTLYKWRSIDKVIRNFWDHSCFKNMITKEKISGKVYYEMKSEYCNTSLNILMQMIEDTYDSTRIYPAKNKGPNKPEALILSILLRIHPNEWEFTGDKSKERIGRRWPDLTCYKYKLIIEHFGDYHHSEIFTHKSKKDHEKERIKEYKELGWKPLVIWEKETADIKKLEQKIIKFIEKYTGEILNG